MPNVCTEYRHVLNYETSTFSVNASHQVKMQETRTITERNRDT